MYIVEHLAEQSINGVSLKKKKNCYNCKVPKKSAFMCFILFYLILIVILSAIYQGCHLKFTR